MIEHIFVDETKEEEKTFIVYRGAKLYAITGKEEIEIDFDAVNWGAKSDS